MGTPAHIVRAALAPKRMKTIHTCGTFSVWVRTLPPTAVVVFRCLYFNGSCRTGQAPGRSSGCKLAMQPWMAAAAKPQRALGNQFNPVFNSPLTIRSNTEPNQ